MRSGRAYKYTKTCNRSRIRILMSWLRISKCKKTRIKFDALGKIRRIVNVLTGEFEGTSWPWKPIGCMRLAFD